jgi:type VI secretion system protein ImpG
MDFSGAAAQLTAASEIPRGTQLTTRPVRGAVCTFRTAYPVTVAPVALAQAVFAPIIDAPEAVRPPPQATSAISIKLTSTSAQVTLAQLRLPRLRVFIDGEASFCAALRDALFMRGVCAYVEADGDGRWVRLPGIPVTPAGFGEDEALIDFPARSHAAYRLLTEYFCFPEKFNFFDIDIAALTAALPSGCRTITLHLALSGLRTDSNMARILGMLSANNLLLGCTPVVNLFRQRGEPIRLTHASASTG